MQRQPATFAGSRPVRQSGAKPHKVRKEKKAKRKNKAGHARDGKIERGKGSYKGKESRKRDYEAEWVLLPGGPSIQKKIREKKI